MLLAHRICLDAHHRLEVMLDPIDDPTKSYYIKDYLQTAGCQQMQDNIYTYDNPDTKETNKRIEWFVDYFPKHFGSSNVDICDDVKSILESIYRNKEFYKTALSKGEEIKKKDHHNPNISDRFRRRLMDYQKESVEHMIEVGNAANFSVPGSGKTTITYAAISRWIDDDIVRKILVIGPTSSFLPWEEEYESCFGQKPRSLRVSGDMADIFSNRGDLHDLILMHFNTAMNHCRELRDFMIKWKTVLIIDESHYIKSPGLGTWARTAIDISNHATRRIVLSGTPMPNDEKDLWAQITFLWPENFPLGNRLSYHRYVHKQGIGKHRNILNSLFCRITKRDLNLPDPQWKTLVVDLNSIQRKIYDTIAAKTLKELLDVNIRDQAQLQRFRTAKMIRLLQTASNPSLLYEMSDIYDIDSEIFGEAFGMPPISGPRPEIDISIMDQITNYSKLELPSKIVAASELTKKLVSKGNKVIIWSTFIHNMYVFQNSTLQGLDPLVINGTVPRDPNTPGNRDELLNKFKNDDAQVLVASPASLGESVSLHKNLKGANVCNHAIYLDRNFNGAQYMQSMDRIHRIGMDTSVTVEYHRIIGKDTIDEVIDNRLDEKWRDMLNTLNDDMLESLDINPVPKYMDEKEFHKDYQATIDYLKNAYG